jgi:hypothetical protein
LTPPSPGLLLLLLLQDFSDTVFLPTNAAFEKAKVKVADTPKVSNGKHKQTVFLSFVDDAIIPLAGTCIISLWF